MRRSGPRACPSLREPWSIGCSDVVRNGTRSRPATCSGALRDDHDRRLRRLRLTDDPITKSIGLSLAVGVLADAFIVRLTLVPAVMSLLGSRAWWMPERMSRLCPQPRHRGRGLAKGVARS